MRFPFRPPRVVEARDRDLGSAPLPGVLAHHLDCAVPGDGRDIFPIAPQFAEYGRRRVTKTVRRGVRRQPCPANSPRDWIEFGSVEAIPVTP